MFGSTFESIFEGASFDGSSDYETRMLIESVEKEAEDELEKEKEVAIAVSDADEKDVESLEEATLEVEMEYARLEEATVKTECEIAMRAATLKFRNVTEGVDISEAREELKSIAEASMGGAVDKVKAFFKKVWAKIVAFLKRMRSYFDQIFMKNKEFVKKYESDVLSANLKDFEVKEYPVIEYIKKSPSSSEKLKKLGLEGAAGSAKVASKHINSDESASDVLEKLKLELANSLASSTLSNSSDLDIKEELIKEVTGGDDNFEKDTLSYGTSEARVLLAYIRNSNDVNKEVESLRKTTDKLYSDIIKGIESASKNYESGSSTSEGYGITKDYLSFASSQFTKAVDQTISTVKLITKSSRNIVGAMYRYGSKGKGEKANESTSLLDKYL